MLLENNIQTIVEKGSSFLGDIGVKRRRIVEGLEDLYQEFSASFVGFFGTRGPLRHWLWDTTAAIRGVVASRATISMPPSPISHSDETDVDADADEDSSTSVGWVLQFLYCFSFMGVTFRKL